MLLRFFFFQNKTKNYNVYMASLVAHCRICLQCRRPGFDRWVGKITGRKELLLTPVFWPGEFYGQRSLGGYSPWGSRVGHN